jgi:signal transduction histidine kinase
MGDEAVREIRIGCTLRMTEAEFYVSDTGMGIDPEDIGKIFYVFRRGKNAADGSIAGKGVGLASVKSIIETYNGSIWVQSQRGQGSTFTFTINGQYVPDVQKIAAAETAAAAAPKAEQMTDEQMEEAGTALAELMEV